jgi:molybdate transport system ATP-binding protein
VADRASVPARARRHPPPRGRPPRRQPDGSPRNTWQATVDALDIHDDQVRVHLDGPIPIVAQITAAALADLASPKAARLWVAVKATEIDHWPA